MGFDNDINDGRNKDVKRETRNEKRSDCELIRCRPHENPSAIRTSLVFFLTATATEYLVRLLQQNTTINVPIC